MLSEVKLRYTKTYEVREYSSSLVQDRTQNWVHKNGFFYLPFGKAPYYKDYSQFKSGMYFYGGYNNPYSLWGK
ncbi:MAG: hypothetical protein JNK36_11735 [Bacteroidia bacterium]|nr:hypothetical protein [Bacteroidia bacterium]HOZ89786.1 hypothetical protein [Bacteroidia bacterium]HRB52136.1 hypothetical protein [Bacteroidia bacterium]